MDESQEDITSNYLAEVEKELQGAIKPAGENGNSQLHDMLAHHMGWDCKETNSETRGKRIRPLLVLLTCSAAGGDWQKALPAAVAVELVHNFSLIHDDIEDNSPLRRGRTTVWKKWGIPQAINAGDAMLTLAHLHILHLSDHHPYPIIIQAIKILQDACLHLTQGQFLDLNYEDCSEVSIDDYWMMVAGKTAALISATTELGALTAHADKKTCEAYRNYGRYLGMAFQVQDDLLGIWGNSTITGKSNQSDLISKKKTLPVLYGLAKSKEFIKWWHQGSISIEELNEIIGFLEADGVKEYTLANIESLTKQALIELERSHPTGIAGQVLINLTESLIHRQT